MTRLESERRRRGWSQTALAYHTKMSNAEISKFERGYARPYPAQAKRLSRVLGLREDDLLTPVAESPR